MGKKKARAKKRAPPKAAPSTTTLKERHRKFVEAFMGVAAGNGVEAARIAGYRGDNKALATRAAELTHRPDIQAAMQKRVEADPIVATRAQRQEWWTTVMQDDNVGMKERLEASKLLARTQGDFVERHEHTVNAGVMILLPDNGRGDGPPALPRPDTA